jgi:hypothetical protein
VTLATPFIHARTRSFSGWLFFLMVLFGVFLIMVAGTKAVTKPRSFLDWTIVALGAVFIIEIALCAVGAVMHRGLFQFIRGAARAARDRLIHYFHAPAAEQTKIVLGAYGAVIYGEPFRFIHREVRKRLIPNIHAPAVKPEDLLVVRAAGDEASGLLVMGQFIGWVSAVSSRLLSNIWLWACILFAVEMSILLVVVLGLGFGVVLAAGYMFVAAGFIVVTAMAMMLGASMVFGLDGPFVCLFASCSAEAAPPGTVTVLQLKPSENTHSKRIAHSLLCDDDQVIRRIVETIRR